MIKVNISHRTLATISKIHISQRTLGTISKIYLCQFGDSQANDSKDILILVTYLSHPVTLKMRSMPSETNQLLSLSQWYIYVSSEKIHQLIQEIFFIQDYNLENGVKVTKKFICFKPVKIKYQLKSDEYPSIF